MIEEYWNKDWVGRYDNNKRAQGLVKVINELDLGTTFSLCDFACGTGEILRILTKSFPYANFSGLDMCIYDEWKEEGVNFIKWGLDEYITMFTCGFDIVMALNTLYVMEPEYQAKFFKWAAASNGKYFILDIPSSMTPWCGEVRASESIKNLDYIVVDLAQFK